MNSIALIKTYSLSKSVAREYLYHATSWTRLQSRTPAVVANYFLLRYPASLLRQRVTSNGCIVVDSIPYQVVYHDCTPATISKNNIEVWASFRRFVDDFGLPATVIVYPVRTKTVLPL